MTAKFDHVLQLKITLSGSQLPIWRRIVVPCTCSFWELHVAIQAAMGWLGYHLHAFKVVVPLTAEAFEVGIPADDPMSEASALPGWNVPVAGILTLISRKCTYTYDFGDNWVHAVLLEKILPRDKDVDFPVCTAGRRACPPDDCGGIGSYMNLVDGLADPAHPEHERAVELLGAHFDPSAFDPSSVTFQDPTEALERIGSDI